MQNWVGWIIFVWIFIIKKSSIEIFISKFMLFCKPSRNYNHEHVYNPYKLKTATDKWDQTIKTKKIPFLWLNRKQFNVIIVSFFLLVFRFSEFSSFTQHIQKFKDTFFRWRNPPDIPSSFRLRSISKQLRGKSIGLYKQSRNLCW